MSFMPTWFLKEKFGHGRFSRGKRIFETFTRLINTKQNNFKKFVKKCFSNNFYDLEKVELHIWNNRKEIYSLS